MSARSKVWVRGRSPAEVVGSYTAGGHGFLSLLSFVCYEVEVSKGGRYLVQRRRNECGSDS